jgi:hypothetical protein
MKLSKQITIAVLIVAVLSIGLFPTAAPAINLGSILKVGGIAFLVSEYGSQIDRFINSALGERDAQAFGQTKVVPILSVGRGGYIGASQVVGAAEQVKRVKAVVQAEARFGSFRANVFVPVATEKVSKTPERVTGTGVSAVVEFHI